LSNINFGVTIQGFSESLKMVGVDFLMVFGINALDSFGIEFAHTILAYHATHC